MGERRFWCPYLEAEVALTDERETHIRLAHPVDAHEILAHLEATLAGPTRVRRSTRHGELQFARWTRLESGERYVVAIIVGYDESAHDRRYWIVTAFTARRMTRGEGRWTDL